MTGFTGEKQGTFSTLTIEADTRFPDTPNTQLRDNGDTPTPTHDRNMLPSRRTAHTWHTVLTSAVLCASRMFTTATWPSDAAMLRGVIPDWGPPTKTVHVHALACRQPDTTTLSMTTPRTRITFVAMWLSAPACSSTHTTSACPRALAANSGVRPSTDS